MAVVNNLQQESDDSQTKTNRQGGTVYYPPLPIDIVRQSGQITEELLTFGEEAAADEVTFGGKDTRSRVASVDVSLENFLSRPVKIHSFGWGTVQFYQTFNPWVDFLTNKRVSNRISNYLLLKGNLHLKFMINGNGFYFGKLMASYLPFRLQDNLTADVSTQFEDNIQMSQLPKIFIDPTLSQGGIMHVPFLYQKDYLDIVRNDQLAVGNVSIRELNPLRNVNTAITADMALTVSVYAWMTDVELQAPTSDNVFGIVPQSGKEAEVPPDEEDTTENKVVSQTATAIAKTASTAAAFLAPVAPQLAMGATAIAKGAQLTGAVASALGYSRPTQQVDPNRYVPNVVDSVALTNNTCITEKLTTDAKQELSISTAEFGGRDEDELSLPYITKQESFWYKVSWPVTATPETLLTNFVLNPISGRIVTILGDDTYFFPAVAGASLPFEYWTGSLKFRFQIVSSAFHRGKLAIVFDAAETPAGGREDNVAYTNIVDISEQRDFTIEVDNHQAFAWLRTRDSGLMEQGGSIPRSTIDGTDNGTMSIYVLNELTVPKYDAAVAQDVEINIYISGGKNFRLAKPGNKFSEFSVGIVPQSGVADAIDDTPDAEQHNEHMTTQLAQDTRVYIGEEISSFRALLKRFSPYIAFHSANNNNIREITLGMYPLYRGYGVDGIHFTPLLVKYNYCMVTLMTYLRPAFSLMRGSVRYKVLPMTNDSDTSVPKGMLTVTRNEGELHVPNVYKTVNCTSDVAASSTLMSLARAIGGNSGNAVTAVNLNPGLSFELPFYSQYKFVQGKPTNFDNSSAQVWDSFTVAFPANTNDAGATDMVAYEYHVAAGEDFTLGVFTGWPRMYKYTSLP
uniref:Putative structural protein n=1 Tax=Picornavirales Q_sR_OV_020 TaxID=2016073 RepID=A0A218NJT8_9VIRU|nr:putative structural protein [Picornavirales Q_sR_OV_020]